MPWLLSLQRWSELCSSMVVNIVDLTSFDPVSTRSSFIFSFFFNYHSFHFFPISPIDNTCLVEAKEKDWWPGCHEWVHVSPVPLLWELVQWLVLVPLLTLLFLRWLLPLQLPLILFPSNDSWLSKSMSICFQIVKHRKNSQAARSQRSGLSSVKVIPFTSTSSVSGLPNTNRSISYFAFSSSRSAAGSPNSGNPSRALSLSLSLCGSNTTKPINT